jgi:heme-degrading monooxygenase HmoA
MRYQTPAQPKLAPNPGRPIPFRRLPRGTHAVQSPLLAFLVARTEAPMVARVTHYRIRPGKLEEFTATVQSLTAAMDKLKGFRVLLVLRGDESSGQEAMAMSIWDSVEDMKDSDSDSFYYHVVSKLIGCCESFSPMHEQEVMVSKFANC